MSVFLLIFFTLQDLHYTQVPCPDFQHQKKRETFMAVGAWKSAIGVLGAIMDPHMDHLLEHLP